MRKNYENGNVEKIPQQRWCCGDSPWLFKERWEKIFEDWVGVKQEKFDPSRVSQSLFVSGWSGKSLQVRYRSCMIV